MNIRLAKKMQDRLVILENQADELKNQITDLGTFESIRETLIEEKLKLELNDTLNRIKHISAANKNYQSEC